MGITTDEKLQKKSAKGDTALILFRVNSVAQYLIKGYSYSDILANCSKNWGLAERTIKHYVSDAYKIIEEDVKKDVSENLNWHLKVRLDHYRDLVKLRDNMASNMTINAISRMQTVVAIQKQIGDITKDMARLQGLYVDKVQVDTNVEMKSYILPDGTKIDL